MEEQRKLYEILVQKNDVTWQSIIQDLVKKGEIDPWNIDISWISQEYLKEIKKMQEMNFFISGKMILASAILLKLKSEKLLNEDIASLDHIMFPSDNIDELDDFLPNEQKKLEFIDNPNLTIRTPQARKRRVSIADLISALEQALEINTKRLIEELFEKIIIYLKEKNDLKFNNLLSEKPNRDEIIGTFVPLLHLDNQQRIKLEQEKHFGEINIRIK